ncbi:iron-sulfur cluster carrier protein ApbC [Acidithiobacillus sp.]|jgi:ATP-binding protein involved in chromosome partitioning|uniref:iron-sulfur cluster carrier protein ApbC n=1 Tax=Acidithiobacillus sp. TaxID=1872118 RepID=UPI0025C51A91|nr:iron-sulfur cluster carrier protein ApbC [Acidithiobacillus sp.]MCK9189076.1 iron-sulfur cluster carrier protein ApbC [Acidithiobacillus sp.]MCK9359263.1 iron-sulfur cluster carrier protein ApbC [Acidithiobacillus sp.]
MTGLTREQIEQSLRAMQDPYLGKDLAAAGVLKGVDGFAVKLELPYPSLGVAISLSEEVARQIQNDHGISAQVTVGHRILSHQVQRGVKLMEGIKNVIAVASGKGGVGKSTTAVNLALALAKEGAKVGMLDADIYGPSQPRMLGISGKPTSKDGKKMEPMEGHGIKAMSIGFLIDDETPMVWRGPMVMQALEQLLSDTRWGELDYLVVDLPPGTGDTQLTLAQKVPVSGAVIVTTPQDIALLDARKGLKMFEKVGVPILGIIENMSFYICPKCGNEDDIFGHGGGAAMAEQDGVEFLGAIPLDRSIRNEADNGAPTVVAQPDSRLAKIYLELARHVAGRVAIQAVDHSHKFPNIVVQNR